MAITRSRYRTATSVGTFVAFLLVLIFGSPWYVDWTQKGDRGVFLETLAWPGWNLDTDASVRDVLGADLKAILLVVFTALFLTLLVGAQLASARGTLSAIFTGWAAYMFAAALAAFLTTFLLPHASLGQATLNAAGGAGYGLIVGWIIGLATMAGRRP
ncbi:hypothetical protein [Dactylosporangium sp. CA-092794]|uniref:hypothetical protein n=1 Tax=Dactylosporangium sp. CA-092794 TaxID=3239929 RepID=UPI003D8FE4F6